MQLCWVSSNRRVAVVFAVPRLVLFMVRSFFPLVGVPALLGTAGRSCCNGSARPRRLLPLLLTFTLLFSWLPITVECGLVLGCCAVRVRRVRCLVS